MKSVKNLVYAVLLASILAVNAFGGDQGTPASTNPSPSPSPEGMVAYDETLPDVYDPNTGSLSETSDSLFYEALAALLSVY
ncbi:MAG TPA: hypothetical protein VN724_05085 [Pyrinomonadaceae bacterium]|jgi:hypothetical protein|nr:hypothetical protein [Pyrinomonadaceae bacterium]